MQQRRPRLDAAVSQTLSLDISRVGLKIRRPTRGTLVTLHDGRVSVLCKAGALWTRIESRASRER
jgi:hypothetical protein